MAIFKAFCVMTAAVIVANHHVTSLSGRISFEKYPTLDTIERYLDDIARRFRGFVTVSQVGRSHEGRDIHLVSIGNQVNSNSVWIDAGEHFVQTRNCF